MAFVGRTTFFFEMQKYGWSETYYSNLVDMSAMATKAQLLATPRIKLLATPAKLVLIRMSDDSVKRDSRVMLPTYHGGLGLAVDAECDQPYSALLLRLVSGDNYRRPLFLRGVADILINSVNGFTPSPDFTANFNAYKNRLKSDGWCLKALDKTILAVPHAITACDNGTPIQITSAGHGLASGDRVRISGVLGTTSANGDFTIDVVTDNSFTLRQSVGNGVYLGGGNWSKLSKGLFAITDALWERQVSRDTGRPFALSRGRRPSKK